MSWNKKKIRKTIIIVVCSLLAVFAGVGWFILSRIETIVAKQLEDNTTRLSNGLYHVKMDKMNVHLLNGYLSINGLTLYPDSSRLEYLRSVDSIPSNYATVYIQSLEFKGINFRKKSSREGRHLNFSEIAFVAPYVRLTHNEQGIKAVKDTIHKPKALYDIIAPVFDEIRIKNTRIDDGRVEVRVESATDTAVYAMKNVNFRAEDFLVDSAVHASNRIFYCKDLHFDVENAHHTLPGKSYSFDLGKISLSIKDSIFAIENFKLTPSYPKMEFASMDPGHSDWMELSAGKIECKGIHFDDLIFKKFINIREVYFKDVDFSDFKNQKIVIQHHKMPMLYESFQRLKYPVKIGRMEVDNLDVVYEELGKNGSKPGLISFTGIQAEILGFTNIVSSPGQNYQLVARAKLMNEGELNATIHFPVDSLSDRFEIIGSLGPMSMTSFNRIIEPLAPARINEGHINGMDFHIVGNKQQAKIDMELLYHDLSVTIMKENETRKRSNMQLVSLLANGLIETDNPETGKESRRVQSEYVRDPYHSSFNYLWKIFFSGITETVGYTDQRKKDMQWVKATLNKLKGGHDAKAKHNK